MICIHTNIYVYTRLVYIRVIRIYIPVICIYVNIHDSYIYSYIRIHTTVIYTSYTYSQLEIVWHSILRLFLLFFDLVPGVPGFSWD